MNTAKEYLIALKTNNLHQTNLEHYLNIVDQFDKNPDTFKIMVEFW